MFAVNVLGSLFYVLILYGTHLIAEGRRPGWMYRTAGNVGWLVLGAYLGLWSVVVFEFCFIYIDVRAWYRWGQNIWRGQR